MTRRRKLALLTLLALSPRPLTRDRLTATFWGDQDDDRARHSLADTLSHLRRVLGKDAVTLRQEEISLGNDIPLAVDALEFRAAVAARDPVRATSIYGGAFLDGVHISDAVDFDDWASREREQLARTFADAARAATDIHATA
ncbi:MAG: AfsR/SARP family transcriptional regulator, partial [Gemmatimonadales bacterium]